MKNRYLPVEIEIDGEKYPINKKGDYEVILDVIEVLIDNELTEQERIGTALCIFYDFNIPSNIETAVNEMYKFINYGEEEKTNTSVKPIMNWSKDFPLLTAPINRVVGYDIRSRDYVHWWTVVSAYMEIGKCTFQTIISIRDKKRKGKKLDKWEEEFYKENRSKIDLSVDFSPDEEKYFKDLLGIDFK